jgi:outer membrane protein assembly factor BamB
MGGDGPRATPTFFNGKLVTVGARGLLNCFDAATGKVLWSRDAVAENDSAPPMWGLSSSAFAFHSEKHGDLVVMSPGGAGGKSLHAYRLDDGKEVWSVGDDAAGYATPDLKSIGGVPQIIVLQWQAVSGHDPETGAELWRYNDPHDWETINPKVPQPIVLDDRRVLMSAGYGTGCVLLELTKQADGKFTVEKKWRSTKLKPKFTNLVVRDGFVYGLDDGAFLVCLDLADGELKWRSKRGADYGHGQILLVDDLLIVQSETGDIALVAADPKKFEELGRFTALPTGVSWNQPIVTGRKLLVRNDKEAVCYELPTE